MCDVRKYFEMGFNQLKGPVFIVLLYILTSLFIFSVTQRKNYTISAQNTVNTYIYTVSAEIAHCLNFELFSGKKCESRENLLWPTIVQVKTTWNTLPYRACARPLDWNRRSGAQLKGSTYFSLKVKTWILHLFWTLRWSFIKIFSKYHIVLSQTVIGRPWHI